MVVPDPRVPVDAQLVAVHHPLDGRATVDYVLIRSLGDVGEGEMGVDHDGVAVLARAEAQLLDAVELCWIADRRRAGNHCLRGEPACIHGARRTR